MQTGKSHMLPIVMIDEPGGDYWKTWEHMIDKLLLQRGMIAPADRALYKVTDSIDEAVREVVGFYRVYHSMRYVHDHLVLRLHRPLGEGLLEQIRADFADILQGGTFEPTTALPDEANDPHLIGLPRLRFRFDRKSLGRLRMLIDTINREGDGRDG